MRAWLGVAIEVVGGPLDGERLILDAARQHQPMLEVWRGNEVYRLDPQAGVFRFVGVREAKRTRRRRGTEEEERCRGG